jgi:hypothetical protein
VPHRLADDEQESVSSGFLSAARSRRGEGYERATK